MINFLKEFFAGEKSAEEQALMGAPRKRDVLILEGYEEAEEQQPAGCGSGCGGCACR